MSLWFDKLNTYKIVPPYTALNEVLKPNVVALNEVLVYLYIYKNRTKSALSEFSQT